jgi:2-phosphoglycolate phosphatase
MTQIRAVLFDLDGTLLDSAPDLVAALNWVRKSEGLAELEVDPVSRYVSRGAAGLLLAGMPKTDEDQFESWKSSLLAHYASHYYEKSVLYPGIPEVLDFLDDSAVPWGIVTNKMEALTLPIVKAVGWGNRTNCVVCGDTLSRHKPDPAPVRLACDILRVSAAETLFVGDDIRDVQAGRAAGTKIAAVDYGYGSHELSEEPIADSEWVHQPSDLIALLQASRA